MLLFYFSNFPLPLTFSDNQLHHTGCAGGPVVLCCCRSTYRSATVRLHIFRDNSTFTLHITMNFSSKFFHNVQIGWLSSYALIMINNSNFENQYCCKVHVSFPCGVFLAACQAGVHCIYCPG